MGFFLKVALLLLEEFIDWGGAGRQGKVFLEEQDDLYLRLSFLGFHPMHPTLRWAVAVPKDQQEHPGRLEEAYQL